MQKLESEPTYSDIVVQHVSHNSPGTPQIYLKCLLFISLFRSISTFVRYLVIAILVQNSRGSTAVITSFMRASFFPIDWTLSGATIMGQSEPWSDSNEEVLGIPPCSSTTGTSPSDCLVSCPEHLLMGEVNLCREAVGVFCSPSRLGKKKILIVFY